MIGLLDLNNDVLDMIKTEIDKIEIFEIIDIEVQELKPKFENELREIIYRYTNEYIYIDFNLYEDTFKLIKEELIRINAEFIDLEILELLYNDLHILKESYKKEVFEIIINNNFKFIKDYCLSRKFLINDIVPKYLKNI